MEANSLVPKLRFKDYKENWELKTLGQKGTLINGLTYNPNDIVDNGVLVLRSSNVQDGQLAFEDSVFVNVKSYNPVKENDILICVRNGSKRLIGKNALITKSVEGSAFGAFMTVYRSLNNNFIFYLFSLSSYYKIIHKNLGATINSINNNDLKKFKFHFPTLPEQNKIASFLTSVDKKINLLTKKKALLETYKKGVMQKIFSQEIRFKDEDGKDFPDWEFKRGNELFDSISNKKHNSDLPILAISQELGAVPRKQINYKISVTNSSVSSYKIVEKGDFIISLRSFQGGIEYSNYKGICSPAYIILKSTKEINDYYFKVYFKTHKYIQQLTKKLEGIRDGKMISYKYFSEIKLPFPSIKEQNKIASFLSSIDKKIELVDFQLERNKEFKKGLLQQMFV